MVEAVTQWDFSILYFIQEHLRTAFGDFLMPLISALGSGGVIWIVCAVVMVIIKKTRKAGVQVGVALLMCLILSNLILKTLVARDRPFVQDPMAEELGYLVAGPTDGYSFPSGHTVSSFAAATAIFLWNKKFGAGAYVLAALIGFSRLYNFVHFPTDVLCGIAVGVLFGVIAHYAVEAADRAIKKKRSERTATAAVKNE